MTLALVESIPPMFGKGGLLSDFENIFVNPTLHSKLLWLLIGNSTHEVSV